MRALLLAVACIALVGCKKERFGDNPATDIIGTWYYIGYDDESGVFHSSAVGKKASYKFEGNGEYQYWSEDFGWQDGGTWEIKSNNRLYLDSDEDWKYIKFEDGKLKKAQWWGQEPRTTEEWWNVYEQ
jgi:hypothetical protein